MLVSLAGQFSETRFTGVWASLNFVLLVGFVMAMPILPLLSGTTKRSYPPGQWRSVRGVVCPHSLQHLWRTARDTVRFGARQRWLSPADSPRSVGLPFLLLVLGPGNRADDLTPALNAFITLGKGAPLFEETFFRWGAAYVGGSSGIIVGSVVWALFHPVNRLLFQNIRLLEVARFTPLWILDAVFYVRVWRGRYYWVSFFAHALTNIAIVLGGMSGLP